MSRLEIFGSVVTGRFDPESSDLDFLVEFETGSPGELAERYLGLLTDMESLFGRPVDLLMPAAVENPYFLRQIESSRKLLYLASGENVSRKLTAPDRTIELIRCSP